jgi:hypothetical protein
MKAGVFIALAALALAVVAVPEAQGKSGGDVDQRISGSVFVTDVDDTGVTTSSASLLAIGQPGTAQVQGLIVFEPVLGVDGRCPEEFPLGSDLISLDFVETFNDGSLLIGTVSPGQAVCTNGVTNIVDVVGRITRGTGRFEGASGTWQVEASTPAGPDAGATGSFTADLD